ncbi:MAG: potassium channel family protein [Candidatus Pacearchaeota archaeon]
MRHIRIMLAIIIIFALLAAGTIQFHFAENWSWIDSFYFTGATITTIGYGDITPTKPLTKIFTVVYAIIAIGTFLFAISEISEEILRRRFENMFNFLKSRIKKNQKTLAFMKRKV